MTDALTIAVCERCGYAAHPPRILCPRCAASDWRRREAAGGVVEELTVRRADDGGEHHLASVRSELGPVVIARVPEGTRPGDRVRLGIRQSDAQSGGMTVAEPEAPASEQDAAVRPGESSPTGLAADELRQLMSHWATGVSVLTGQMDGGEPRGCTANAVTSLSLEPLLILACFDLGSNTLEAVRRTGRFGVNILAHDQLELSRRFAGKAQRKFEGLAHSVVEGVPVIDGALAWMVCDVREEMEGGDHAIVIGVPLRGDVRQDAHPLVFFRRRYGRVAV